MRIGAFQKTSLVDYPDRVAAVVYTQGCNMRCPFCHNPSMVLPECFERAIPEAEIFSALLRRQDRLEAVVITGGEPTLQGDLVEFVGKIRSLGLLVKLDTNGTRPEVIQALLRDELLDYIAMDVKAPLPNYAQLTGRPVDAEAIRRSVWLIRNAGIPYEFRTTVVPGMHTVREIKTIAESLRGSERYVIQEFVSEGALQASLRGRPAFPPRVIEELRPFMKSRIRHFEIRRNEEAVPMPATKKRRAPLVTAG